MEIFKRGLRRAPGVVWGNRPVAPVPVLLGGTGSVPARCSECAGFSCLRRGAERDRGSSSLFSLSSPSLSYLHLMTKNHRPQDCLSLWKHSPNHAVT